MTPFLKGFCDQLLLMITFGDRSVNEASIKCQAGLGVLFLVDDIIFYVQKKISGDGESSKILLQWSE